MTKQNLYRFLTVLFTTYSATPTHGMNIFAGEAVSVETGSSIEIDSNTVAVNLLFPGEEGILLPKSFAEIIFDALSRFDTRYLEALYRGCMDNEYSIPTALQRTLSSHGFIDESNNISAVNKAIIRIAIYPNPRGRGYSTSSLEELLASGFIEEVNEE